MQSFATSSMRIPVSATPTMAEDGDFAIDTTVADFSHGIIKYFDGEEIGVVSMPITQFTTPTGGDVVAYNATNDEFELVTPSGSGITSINGNTTPAQVISGTTNQITVGSAAGTTTIDVGSNVVLTSQSNTYTGGLKQQFLPDATNAGINVGTAAANPSSATNGDMYYNTASGEFRIVRTGTWDDVVTATGTQTLTNKTIDRGTNVQPFSAESRIVVWLDGSDFTAIDNETGVITTNTDPVALIEARIGDMDVDDKITINC